MTAPKKCLVYIDESGQRSPSDKSSDYFIMSAVLIPAGSKVEMERVLGELKRETNRKPDHRIHFSKLKPEHREIVTTRLGQTSDLMTVSVVTCKAVLASRATWTVTDPSGNRVPVRIHPPLSEDEAYLKTYQYLLERVSWLLDKVGATAEITVEHTIRFKAETMREFERLAKTDTNCSVTWKAAPTPAKLMSKSTEPFLQFADIVASSVAAAFNGNQSGVNTKYVHNLRPIIWRGGSRNKPTTYGLKMHPWDEQINAMHPWILNF